MNSQPQQKATQPDKKKYTVLWVMIVLFGLPYLAAYYFYLNRDQIELKTSNYGTIISPVRPLQNIQLTRLDGSTINSADMKGKWILLSIGSSQCDSACQDNLYKIRQLKKAVGPAYKRIQKAFFLTDDKHIEQFKGLLEEYPGMDVIVPSHNNYEDFLSSFSVSGEPIENGIYIIDPLGNYMMAYPSGADARKILKDIERLLKVSKIG